MTDCLDCMLMRCSVCKKIKINNDWLPISESFYNFFNNSLINFNDNNFLIKISYSDGVCGVPCIMAGYGLSREDAEIAYSEGNNEWVHIRLIK